MDAEAYDAWHHTARGRWIGDTEFGLLHRRSLLYLRKGTRGGSGAYRGAHWHTEREARALFEGMPVSGLEIRYAVALPGGGRIAQMVDAILPERHRIGAFVVVAGNVAGPEQRE